MSTRRIEVHQSIDRTRGCRWWAEPMSDRKQYDDADAMCHCRARKQINQRAPVTPSRPLLMANIAIAICRVRSKTKCSIGGAIWRIVLTL